MHEKIISAVISAAFVLMTAVPVCAQEENKLCYLENTDKAEFEVSAVSAILIEGTQTDSKHYQDNDRPAHP